MKCLYELQVTCSPCCDSGKENVTRKSAVTAVGGFFVVVVVVAMYCNIWLNNNNNVDKML